MSRRNVLKMFGLRLVRSTWAQAASSLLLVAGGSLGGSLLAQVPDSTGFVERAGVVEYHFNKRTIHLPIQLDDKYRPQLSEIHLYYKDNLSAPWTLREKAPATQTAFTFQAPQDGTYWFTMVTVDRQGKSVPADLTKEEPAMAVVVDSTPPVVDLLLLAAVPEGHLIQCDVRDANPAPAKTRFQYQTADKVFRDLDAVPDRANIWCIPSQANITGQIRVYACDQAGNVTTRDSSLAQLPSLTKGATPTPMPLAEKVIAPPALPSNTVPSNTVPSNTVPSNSLPNNPFTSGLPMMPAQDGGGSAKSGTLPTEHIVQAVHTVPSRSSDTPVPQVVPGSVQAAPVMPSGPTPMKHEGAPTRQVLVNGTRLFLEYRIDKAGPSGVGRVEIWCTRDMGQTWQKIGEDHSHKSPVEVQLPGEGVYGLSLVVSNGLGFGAQAPGRGDAPDWCIEVDTTKPAAQLTMVRLVPEDGPAVHVGWSSQDRNLGSTPAELSYAVSRQGPWVTIARGLKNEGEFRWVPPHDIGPQAFLRLTVRDQAGNTTVTETTSPVTLDDLSRPRATIAGISTDGSVAPMTTNGGN